MSPKLPRSAPRDLASRSPDVVQLDDVLWRIVDTAGQFAVTFSAMRDYGTLPSARFDPHPPPASDRSGELVSYVATTLLTALAERFAAGREIRRRLPQRPVAYAWRPARPLALLDVSGSGAVRLGASHALNTGPKSVTRTWARALRAAFPDADGLYYASSMTGQPCAALWAPAADSFPGRPEFAEPLDYESPGWQRVLRVAAATLGYDYA